VLKTIAARLDNLNLDARFADLGQDMDYRSKKQIEDHLAFCYEADNQNRIFDTRLAAKADVGDFQDLAMRVKRLEQQQIKASKEQAAGVTVTDLQLDALSKQLSKELEVELDVYDRKIATVSKEIATKLKTDLATERKRCDRRITSTATELATKLETCMAEFMDGYQAMKIASTCMQREIDQQGQKVLSLESMLKQVLDALQDISSRFDSIAPNQNHPHRIAMVRSAMSSEALTAVEKEQQDRISQRISVLEEGRMKDMRVFARLVERADSAVTAVQRLHGNQGGYSSHHSNMPSLKHFTDF
jgi:hypothetical protein